VREPAEENLRRQVAPMLMAERTPGSDGLRRHRLHGRRDILSAALTVNHYAFRALWSGEHELQYRRIKGEGNPQVFADRFAASIPGVRVLCFAVLCPLLAGHNSVTGSDSDKARYAHCRVRQSRESFRCNQRRQPAKQLTICHNRVVMART
jgi:hypothetical protein